MNEVIALATKDLRLLVRDKVGFFFVLVFPLIYCIFFGTVFSSGGGDGTNTIPIAVVDEDRTDGSRGFVDALVGTSELEVQEIDRAAASSLVRRGKLVAYVAIPPGFGERRDGMFFGQPPRIEVGIDPSRRAEAGMLKGLLIKCAFQRLQELISNPDLMAERVDSWLGEIRASDDMNPMWRGALEFFLPALSTFVKMASAGGDAVEEGDDATATTADDDAEASGGFGGGWQPIVIEKADISRERTGPANAYAVSFPQGIIWGVLGCSAAFGISLVVERTRGTLVRLRMAPIARWQILAGKAGACFITAVGVMTMLLILAAVFFDVRPTSVALLALAVVCTALAFVGIMMGLSVLGRTEQAAGGIGWAVLLVMAMLGGGMVPLMFMRGWMRTASHVSPVKWAIQAMEGAIWREFSLSEMILPCGILIGVGFVCFVVGVCAFRWTE